MGDGNGDGDGDVNADAREPWAFESGTKVDMGGWGQRKGRIGIIATAFIQRRYSSDM
jgi:hypothetical protein